MTTRFLNGDFFAAVGWDQGSEVPAVVTLAVIIWVITISLPDTIDGFARALRR